MFGGIFGGGKPAAGAGPAANADGFGDLVGATAAAGSGGRKDAPASGSSGASAQAGQGFFDPSGLERAAKAARDLDGSRNAKEALEIVRMQEVTKQQELQLRRKEAETQYKALDLQRIEKEGEERRKTIETETSHLNYRAKQQDELARKRQQEQIAAQKALQDEQLRKQEESLAKQEAMRRSTIEYEQRLKRDTELAKVMAEADGRIKEQRENRDVALERLRAEANEKRETVLQAIRQAGTTLGDGFSNFITDGDKVFATITGLSLLALGVYGARSSTAVIGRFVESRIGKPTLVRETSRRPPLYSLLHPIAAARGLISRLSSDKKQRMLDGIVLSPLEETRLRDIVWSTINAKKNRAPLRNLLLHGPPGTGKTMFAKRLALNSGLDYAIMTGGDVLPLGREAVSEIHKTFDWASTNSRGTLLFIDEADAFLRQRDRAVISEDMRTALNAFLYRTGETSKKFMVVLASNQPEQLDSAIQDRLDELVPFSLPGSDERFRMLTLYFNMYVRDHHKVTGAKPIDCVEITEKDLEQVAIKARGFSGRELSKLAIALQANAYATESNTVTRAMFNSTVESYLKQHALKDKWAEGAPQGDEEGGKKKTAAYGNAMPST